MKKIALLLTALILISMSIKCYAKDSLILEDPKMFIQATESVKKELKAGDIEYIYNHQIPCDVKFENNLDPYEQQDNYSYIRSPYPLIRTVMDMYSQKTLINPGYYLLTPRKINGRDYMLFKQQGKVLYSVPIFAEVQVDPDKEYPQPKDPYESAPFGLRSIWKFFGIISGRRTPIARIPEHKIDCFQYNDMFYGINVYYKDRMYKTVYKIKRYE